MKKKLVLMLIGVFILCGCEAKQETTLTINEDKSMNFEVIMGYDDELIDAMMSMGEGDLDILEPTPGLEDETLPEENDEEIDLPNEEEKENTDEERKQYLKDNSNLDMQEMIKKGYTVLEFQDEKYTGYKISKKINSIDDLVGIPDFTLDDYAKIDEKKIFTKDGSVYKGEIIVGDPTDMEGQENIGSSASGINLIYTFTLNLPNKVKSSNATTVSEDGKTLTWNLASGSISTIKFEFEFPSIFTFLKDNMILTAGIAVAVVLIIVIIIALILKKSKAKNDKELNDIVKTNLNESTITQNDSMTSINPTEINTQNINQPVVENQMAQPQSMNNQLENQVNAIPPQNIEMPQIQNNIGLATNSQGIMPQEPQIVPTPEVNLQQNIQQPIQSNNPETIITAMNSIPVVSTPQQEMSQLNQQPVENVTPVIPSNPIPPIQPVVPTPINAQPIVQENTESQIQTTNAQQGLSFVTGTTNQNNTTPTQQGNINNQ